MDNYEQIGKLAEAYALITEVVQVCDPVFADDLQDMAVRLADISDQIEEG